METKPKSLPLEATLGIIAIGIWAIVLQNAGIIPTPQNVKVVNTVDTKVVNTVDTHVNGGNIEADVSGNVSIDNEVDVDIKKINGWNAANYEEYTIQGEEFHSLGTK
jgi:hypothetical protein